MKVLVVGKGGREHALVWKLAQSPQVAGLWAAPGSPGIAAHAECLPDIRVDLDVSQAERLNAEIVKLRDFALEQGIDLTIVGPESALAAGLVDRFAEAGLTAFGPTAAAARIESDKAFSKALMASIGVPTAAHQAFTDSDAAVAWIRDRGAPIVVKASGLAAGKGAIVCATEAEAITAVRDILDTRVFGDAGAELVIEEFMEGEEASLFAMCDGQSYALLTPAQDHKAVGEGDTGPNTGGMGAYAPAPVMTPDLVGRACAEVIEPVLAEMRRRGTPYHGVLYVGLMMTSEGPKVVEFNCRFGDPETQVLMPLLRSDLATLCLACARGDLTEAGPIELEEAAAAVCVVMASGGYPGSYASGKPISGLQAAERITGVVAFHAGTALDESGALVTAGGRVLGVTAAAANIPGAVSKAYDAVDTIDFEDAYCRRDIAHRALARLGGK